MSLAIASGGTTLAQIAEESARCANGNASRNSYLYFSEESLRDQAASLARRFAVPASRPPLFGVPISLKDCFDLAGTVTTCGSLRYAERHTAAARDSAMAVRLRAAGAMIPGKTQLHPLAYGITGENPDYGDCLQPRDATLLTGGSSSGAAASVQEGSALAAIGTDTGGSIRVPAALCGLAGYRASRGLAYGAGPWPPYPEGLWAGGAHLAPSFDTVGLLVRDARDLAALAHVLFGVPFADIPRTARVGRVSEEFLEDCDADALAAFDGWRAKIASGSGSVGKLDAGSEFDAASWEGTVQAFAGIQAREAAGLHRGHYDDVEPAIAERLRWGASLSAGDLEGMERELVRTRSEIGAMFERFEFLMLPCAPVSQLRAGDDQSAVRLRILRYTAPFSVAGLPVVALPGEMIGAPLGTGVQIAAAPGEDAALLAYAGALAQRIVDERR
jgi:Asp-tRNA(Asn)/Glu-tRNA(Gln) amidotransferase A subunit family amidase